MIKKQLVYFSSDSSAVNFIALPITSRPDLFDGLVLSPLATPGRGLLHADTMFDTSEIVSWRMLADSANQINAVRSQLPEKLFFRVNARTRRDRQANASDLSIIEDRFAMLADFLGLMQDVHILFDAETYGATFPTAYDNANLWKFIGTDPALEFGANCFKYIKCDVILSLGILYAQRSQSSPRYDYLKSFYEGALVNKQAIFHDYIQQGYSGKTLSSHAYYRTHPTLGYSQTVAKYDNYKHGRSIFPQLDWTADEIYNAVVAMLAESESYAVIYDQLINPGTNIGSKQLTRLQSAYADQRRANKRGF